LALGIPEHNVEKRGMNSQAASIYDRTSIEEAKARLRSEHTPPWDELDAEILPIV
jgi:hypothetical protein